MNGTYLYAIMAGDIDLSLGQLGLPRGQVEVTIAPADGLSAVVSEYTGPVFGDLSRQQILNCLALHQRVVERAMQVRPLLPVKFGTVLASRDESATVLRRWKDYLAAALERIGHAVEIELVATWDLQRELSEIGRQPEIVAIAAEALKLPPEKRLAARIQVGKLLKEALDRRREDYGRQALRELASCSLDVQPNLLSSDELVLNFAFMVDRDRLGEFEGRVEQLDALFDDCLTFRCIGPLPPYSFATVKIAGAPAGEIEAARQLLELGDRATEHEVNASFRRLAVRYHPDRNPDDATAWERFSALTAARAQLLACIRSQGRAARPDGVARRCDLASVTAEPALLVEVIRSHSTLDSPEENGHERGGIGA